MAAKVRYSATTKQISVTVNPTYLDHQSAPENSHFVWAYHVVIENHGPRLCSWAKPPLAHHQWRGEVREVRGPGVVGEQPRLEPGEEFEYTSAVPLTTPSGIMMGSYQMGNPARRNLDVETPPSPWTALISQ